MGPDLLPNMLSGLVAIGTLALAAATFSVVRVTRRGGVDAQSHSVIVTQFWVRDVRAESSVTKSAPAIDAGTPWDMTLHGGTHIALQALGHLRNEGNATARLRLNHNQHVTIDSVTNRNWSGSRPVMPFPLVEQEGWYLLPPGGEAAIAVNWRRPASEWAEASRRGAEGHTTAAPPETITLRLIVRGAVARGASDDCTLTFGAYVVIPHPGKDGWIIADNSEKALPPMAAPHPAVAQIGLIKRSYPWRG